jgi:threonine aldolase
VTDDFAERFRAAARACDDTVFWHAPRTPAEVLRDYADAAEALDLAWDRYGEDGAVAAVEEQLAELFGTGAAAFFPSGIMAQQCALRVWCDRHGTRRVAMPDLSHLLVHELDGPRLLHGFEVDHLTTGQEVATAEHLAAIPGRLAAVLVELPLRDAGCALPSWAELEALSAATRSRGAAFHVDGARIWEAQPFWDRPFSDIAALTDSMYVSFYKGLGSIAGAGLVGADDVIAEARRWRKRMGGTMFHLTAEAVGALVGLREELPRMPETLAWARSLAAELPAHGITVQPDPPHAPTFWVYAAGDADEVNERLLTVIERDNLLLCGPWRPADEPGRLHNELAVGAPALAHDPARVAALLGEVIGS